MLELLTQRDEPLNKTSLRLRSVGAPCDAPPGLMLAGSHIETKSRRELRVRP